MQADVRIVASYAPATGEISEHLQLRIDLFDADGNEEISGISVAHDDSGFLWELDASDARRIDRDGQRWFGFDLLPLEGRGVVPRGNYRIEVEDLSGRAGKRTVSIPTTVSISRRDHFVRIEEGGGARTRLVMPPLGGDVEEVLCFFGDTDGAGNGAAATPAGEREVYRIIPSGGGELPTELSGSERPLWLLVQHNRYLWRISGPW